MNCQFRTGIKAMQSLPATSNLCHCSRKPAASESTRPLILVHGGAGKINKDSVPDILTGVKSAVRAAINVLKNGGNAIDATEAAVQFMEDNEKFNAGYGSVLSIEGNVEMDASIMHGEMLEAGAVGCIKNFANPISIARKVMEKSSHVLLIGEGASKFAELEGFELLPDGSLVTENARNKLEKYKKIKSEIDKDNCGTVGAVALDKFGHVVAATSTGGLIGKLRGRVGDTAQIGSGTYADDNVGAVSATGHGESIIKFCLAHRIILAMQQSSDDRISTQEATKCSIDALTKKLNVGVGAISVSRCGEIGIYHSSENMSWAYSVMGEDIIKFGIKFDKCNQEPI
ncbi:isoaspartyl peptidase/L-asparaginase-like [Ctenocephalides felis]|uniref:isoaspartyl peptidase/L-asparaginase-like n=1 Tax=Ctenocephalides felis TaxID=7515 RepID=UPI000E6E2573|nr:isoaspartyl peptidase/L-asparaginase-like [Ctenocephalides felis]XP_026478361.1 isoaspartyl peptidase/L-asparaginase-like [Ctenocephalides felis]